MAELPTTISLELIASGLVGLLLLGTVARRAIEGYLEAQKMIKAPVSVLPAVDHDRLLMVLERIAVSVERQAHYMEELANRRQHDMETQISDIAKRLEGMSSRTTSARRQRKRV